MKTWQSLLTLGLMALAFTASAQTPTPLTFEQLADSVSAGTEKPILVKLHTDWCAYCRMQERQIQRDRELTRLLETDFHFVNFNAEHTADIAFNGHVFAGSDGKAPHELAYALGQINGKLAYPAFILLNKDLEIIDVHHGLTKTKVLRQVLHTVLKKQ